MSTLASHIPSGIVAACKPAKRDIPRRAVAGYQCPMDDEYSTDVEYYLFDNQARFDRAWWADLEEGGITEADEGTACWDGLDGEWSPYFFEEVLGGRMACFTDDTAAEVRSTSTNARILTRISRSRERQSASDVVRWWMDGHTGPCEDAEACY